MGTFLKFNTSYHPQTDDHTKVFNKSLENLLCNYMDKNLKTRDLILLQIKFSYNRSVYQTVGKSLFEIVYGLQPIGLMDLTLIMAKQ